MAPKNPSDQPHIPSVTDPSLTGPTEVQASFSVEAAVKEAIANRLAAVGLSEYPVMMPSAPQEERTAFPVTVTTRPPTVVEAPKQASATRPEPAKNSYVSRPGAISPD